MSKYRVKQIGNGWGSFFAVKDENGLTIEELEFPQMIVIMDLFDMSEDVRSTVLEFAKELHEKRSEE